MKINREVLFVATIVALVYQSVAFVMSHSPIIGVGSRAKAEDIAKCPSCEEGEDDPISVEDIFGGTECKHGPEFDPKCVDLLKTIKDNFNNTIKGPLVAAGFDLDNPTMASLFNIFLNGTPAQKAAAATIIAWLESKPDNECDFFKCAGAAAAAGKECENLITTWSAHCGKDGTGTCKRKDGDVDEVIREEWPGILKIGEVGCAIINGGTGTGDNEVKFCGGGLVNDKPAKGSNCITHSCVADIANPYPAIMGKRLHCDNVIE
jgi:hypothetical protein